MGQGDPPGDAALPIAHLVDHGAQQPRGERFGGQDLVPENERGGVSDPTFELAGDVVRLGDRAAHGGVADQQMAVFADQDDGGDHRSPVSQPDQIELATACHCGCGVRRP